MSLGSTSPTRLTGRSITAAPCEEPLRLLRWRHTAPTHQQSLECRCACQDAMLAPPAFPSLRRRPQRSAAYSPASYRESGYRRCGAALGGVRPRRTTAGRTAGQETSAACVPPTPLARCTLPRRSRRTGTGDVSGTATYPLPASQCAELHGIHTNLPPGHGRPASRGGCNQNCRSP